MSKIRISGDTAYDPEKIKSGVYKSQLDGQIYFITNIPEEKGEQIDALDLTTGLMKSLLDPVETAFLKRIDKKDLTRTQKSHLVAILQSIKKLETASHKLKSA